MKRFISLILCAAMMLTITACAPKTAQDEYKPIAGLDASKKVTIKIAIPYETNKALNSVSNAFMNRYKNVSVQLQYIEDYDVNALKLFKDNALDMILSKDLNYNEYTAKNESTSKEEPTGKTTEDYFYNFAADTEIDFSDTTPDISDNYLHMRRDENGNEIAYQYSYPLGGETRGIFVNKTLLNAYNLKIPANFTELLACCETLKQNGLIPIQGGADTAAFGIGLAPAVNPVVHDKEKLAEMAAAKEGVSKEFTDTFKKIYTLSTNRYFDYKAVEESGSFLSTNELGQTESFLGLKNDAQTFEMILPENNYGYVAFMPYISSTAAVLQSLIDEYKLSTEFTFICSPLVDEGTNGPAYITPYYGICANKNSENLIWVREFVNFLFTNENNKLYAADASIIPNTKDALDFVAEEFHIDSAKDITLCGQIRFSDKYNGYSPVSSALKDVMKCSARKYMVKLIRDESGNIQYMTDENGREYLCLDGSETKIYKEYIGEEDAAMTGYAFCTLQYYIDNLENKFSGYRL